MWIKFIAPFEWRPRSGYVISYREGFVGNVTKRCAEAALAKGKAEKTEKPNGSRVDKSGRTIAGSI